MPDPGGICFSCSKERKGIELLFLGDLCPVGGVETTVQKGHELKVANAFAQELSRKNLTVANLECPLTKRNRRIKKVGPHLKADPSTVALLHHCGVDVASLANNHIMDFGREGFEDTVNVIKRSGIQSVGAGMNVKEACQPLNLSVAGIRVSLLSFCETEFSIADEKNAGCAPIIENRILQAILAAQTGGAEIIVVSLHCGSEHFPLPSPRIQRLCRRIARWGAAAVVCHHSHIYSGFEVFQQVPIFYGLGNFIFDRRYRKCPQHWYLGFMVRIAFSKRAAVGFTLIPYRLDPVKSTLERLDSSCEKAFEKRVQLLSDIIADESRLSRIWKKHAVQRYFQWYLPMLINCQFNLVKSRAKRNMILWHYRTNESHHDVITTALSELRDGTSRTDFSDDGIIGNFYHQSPLHFRVLGNLLNR